MIKKILLYSGLIFILYLILLTITVKFELPKYILYILNISTMCSFALLGNIISKKQKIQNPQKIGIFLFIGSAIILIVALFLIIFKVDVYNYFSLFILFTSIVMVGGLILLRLLLKSKSS